jgi:hypothetical protein
MHGLTWRKRAGAGLQAQPGLHTYAKDRLRTPQLFPQGADYAGPTDGLGSVGHQKRIRVSSFLPVASISDVPSWYHHVLEGSHR